MESFRFTGSTIKHNYINNYIHYEHYSKYKEENKDDIEYIKASLNEYKIETLARITKNTRLLKLIDFYIMDFKRDDFYNGEVYYIPAAYKSLNLIILKHLNLIVIESKNVIYIHSIDQLTRNQKDILELNILY